jgi:3D (Asp-Asp-Asp) domain-containing protein
MTGYWNGEDDYGPISCTGDHLHRGDLAADLSIYHIGQKIWTRECKSEPWTLHYVRDCGSAVKGRYHFDRYCGTEREGREWDTRYLQISLTDPEDIQVKQSTLLSSVTATTYRYEAPIENKKPEVALTQGSQCHTESRPVVPEDVSRTTGVRPYCAKSGNEPPQMLLLRTCSTKISRDKHPFVTQMVAENDQEKDSSG